MRLLYRWRMKRLLPLLVLLFVVPLAQAADPEEAAILAAVDQAYVHGVHIDADPEKMRAGMHEMFIMFVPSDKGITQLSRDAWIERMKGAKPQPATKATLTLLDRAGDAAVVKVEIFRDGKQIFTDYISLYRVSGEWKLIGKIYQRH